MGKITSVTDANGVEITDENHIANMNPLRYRSYYLDAETGFYYLKSRYYAPDMCRFLNADAFTQTGQGLLDKNMFSYCMNNPSNAVDEEGTFTLTFTFVFTCVYYMAIGVAAIGMIGAIWSQPQTQQAVSQIAGTVTANVEDAIEKVKAKHTQKKKIETTSLVGIILLLKQHGELRKLEKF